MGFGVNFARGARNFGGAMSLSWSAAWRIARRDLNRRFRGLRLLLVCLFLGVGALAAIGSLTSAIRGELDTQGRVLIPYQLREAATMGGDVDVLGQYNYLDVWNHDRFLARMQRDPYTDDDARALSEFGI